MDSEKCFEGGPNEYEDPTWQPLLELAPERIVEDFMWMHRTKLENGTTVHVYKHCETRKYVFLDESGCAYTYREGGRYLLADPEWQLRYALRRRDGSSCG